jgi:hypothetical protein
MERPRPPTNFHWLLARRLRRLASIALPDAGKPHSMQSVAATSLARQSQEFL